MIYFGLRNLLKVYSLSAAATQVAEFYFSLLGKQNVLNFYILMKNAQLVHLL
jgi:hypothetical protein